MLLPPCHMCPTLLVSGALTFPERVCGQGLERNHHFYLRDNARIKPSRVWGLRPDNSMRGLSFLWESPGLGLRKLPCRTCEGSLWQFTFVHICKQPLGSGYSALRDCPRISFRPPSSNEAQKLGAVSVSKICGDAGATIWRSLRTTCAWPS